MTTVLLADDNAINRKLTRVVLTGAGYDVVEAPDGDAALRLARECHPALIVMDIQMPGLDGLAVTRALRADRDTAKIKILALTALAMTGDSMRILGAGFDAYCAKPFSRLAFVDTVANLLTEHAP
ncbi:MAG TPA: response regulator [Polyangiaceae bacterium]|jgi:two-component system cell cycle response regulator DivK|nr:response regulator [Polyangiaceae bacterium]